MTQVFRTVSPVDGRVYVERPLANPAHVERVIAASERAFRTWRDTPLAQRINAVEALVAAVMVNAPTHADELTWQMGRPARYAGGELAGFADRAATMIRLAPEALAPVEPPQKAGFRRFITHEPVGPVLILAPWNYPWLCAVNTLVPALVAGNSVIIKHSDQTPLVAERITEAATAAGLPGGLVQHLHVSHALTADIVADPRVAYVAFTGSVGGGRAVHAAAGGHLKAVGLELGGNDPGYVRPDADLPHAIETLVDGAFFNSGQSCCAVERIYVHDDVYNDFVDGFSSAVRAYRLGDPTDAETTLGPLVRASNAEMVSKQVNSAVAMGARTLIDPALFSASGRGAPYLAPQVLIDVTPEMALMREETFGPAVGIARVSDDDEAIRLMNADRFGLTASVFTADLDRAVAIGRQVETGTFFMNRCDFLDPELAWVGVKESGRGVSLSTLGYGPLTRPKSFHLRGTV